MGNITHRGLLWAGGLAATPLPPSAAFGYPDVRLPWDGGATPAASHTQRRTRTQNDPTTYSAFPDIAPPTDPALIRRS